ncbi:hypothetical protein VTO42DRAFT_7500 [Malbranchea cinnamomea]
MLEDSTIRGFSGAACILTITVRVFRGAGPSFDTVSDRYSIAAAPGAEATEELEMPQGRELAFSADFGGAAGADGEDVAPKDIVAEPAFSFFEDNSG